MNAYNTIYILKIAYTICSIIYIIYTLYSKYINYNILSLEHVLRLARSPVYLGERRL